MDKNLIEVKLYQIIGQFNERFIVLNAQCFQKIANYNKMRNRYKKLYIKCYLIYCLKSRKNTENKNPTVAKPENGRIMLLWKCAVCIVKNQD